MRPPRLQFELPTAVDLERMAELVETYADLPLGTVRLPSARAIVLPKTFRSPPTSSSGAAPSPLAEGSRPARTSTTGVPRRVRRNNESDGLDAAHRASPARPRASATARDGSYERAIISFSASSDPSAWTASTLW